MNYANLFPELTFHWYIEAQFFDASHQWQFRVWYHKPRLSKAFILIHFIGFWLIWIDLDEFGWIWVDYFTNLDLFGWFWLNFDWVLIDFCEFRIILFSLWWILIGFWLIWIDLINFGWIFIGFYEFWIILFSLWWIWIDFWLTFGWFELIWIDLNWFWWVLVDIDWFFSLIWIFLVDFGWILIGFWLILMNFE